MFIGGYDTDDLTDRQYHYLQKMLSVLPNGHVNCEILSFVGHCVHKNFAFREFSNYEDDCDYLFNMKKEKLDKYGIVLEKVYLK